MDDLTFRALRPGETELFESLNDPGLVGFAAFGDSYREMDARGDYRPEWSWVAIRGDRVVARAAWWGGPKDSAPLALDWLDFTDFDAAVALLRQAPWSTEYSLLLPVGWRDDPAVNAAATSRIDAVVAAGLKPLVERYTYRWTPADGVPDRPGRLVFRREPDDEVVLEVFRRINDGSLDAHVRRTQASSGPEAAAREQLDLLRWMPSPRDWWRLAYTRDGELVGFSIPARNYSFPIIGYIGVVPEQRGNGYAYDLLVEATHLLADEGVDRIVASTDVTNLPMAAAFARANYPLLRHRLDLVPQT